MFFSILNILDENFYDLKHYQVEIIINNEQGQSIVYTGVSDKFGQIVFPHMEYDEASVYVQGKFQKKITIPCLETISIKTKC